MRLMQPNTPRAEARRAEPLYEPAPERLAGTLRNAVSNRAFRLQTDAGSWSRETRSPNASRRTPWGIRLVLEACDDVMR